MKIYKATVKLSGSNDNTVVKDKLTANDIILIRHIHGADAVVNIEQVGSKKINFKAEWDRLMTTYRRKYVRQCFPGASVRLFSSVEEAGIDITDHAHDSDTPQFLGKNDKDPDGSANLDTDEGDEDEEQETSDDLGLGVATKSKGKKVA